MNAAPGGPRGGGVFLRLFVRLVGSRGDEEHRGARQPGNDEGDSCHYVSSFLAFGRMERRLWVRPGIGPDRTAMTPGLTPGRGNGSRRNRIVTRRARGRRPASRSRLQSAATRPRSAPWCAARRPAHWRCLRRPAGTGSRSGGPSQPGSPALLSRARRRAADDPQENGGRDHADGARAEYRGDADVRVAQGAADKDGDAAGNGPAGIEEAQGGGAIPLAGDVKHDRHHVGVGEGPHDAADGQRGHQDAQVAGRGDEEHAGHPEAQPDDAHPGPAELTAPGSSGRPGFADHHAGEAAAADESGGDQPGLPLGQAEMLAEVGGHPADESPAGDAQERIEEGRAQSRGGGKAEEGFAEARPGRPRSGGRRAGPAGRRVRGGARPAPPRRRRRRSRRVRRETSSRGARRASRPGRPA